MKPTEILRDEHELIKLGLNLLDQMCEKMDKGEKVEPLHLEKVLEFIQVFADDCHHGKEEELLFPSKRKTTVYLPWPRWRCPLPYKMNWPKILAISKSQKSGEENDRNSSGVLTN